MRLVYLLNMLSSLNKDIIIIFIVIIVSQGRWCLSLGNQDAMYKKKTCLYILKVHDMVCFVSKLLRRSIHLWYNF